MNTCLLYTSVYDVYPESDVNKNMADNYQTLEPVNYVIDILKKINELPNVDVYILTLSRDRSITEKKKVWLNKYVNFIDEDKWIIITKELGAVSYTHLYGGVDCGDVSWYNTNILVTEK